MSFLKWRGESAAKKAEMSIADGRRVGETLLLGWGPREKKEKICKKTFHQQVRGDAFTWPWTC
jgi:hypothetical protein